MHNQLRRALGAMMTVTLAACVSARPAAGPGAAADVPRSGGCSLPSVTPQAAGLPDSAVRALIDSARATRSDAFVVLHRGRVVAEWYSDSGRVPIQTMSATKSIVGLATGRLIQDGLLDSLEQPVSTVYPEWRQGRKRRITVGDLLRQTSGLQDVPSDAPEIAPAPDAIRLALAAELMADPGETWFYSNKATNLLGGIVQRLSGKPLDEYIRQSLLEPLCIREARWDFRDSTGNPYAMAGLALHARDLAKLGQLMLDGGTWHGSRILSPAYVEASVRASQPFEPRYGLLWWIHPEWSASTLDSSLLATWSARGLDPQLSQRLAPLRGRRFVGGEWRAALDSALGFPVGSGQGMHRLAEATRQRGVPMRRVIVGPARGFYANGSLGQWLLVLPEEQLVIVRQIRRRPGLGPRDTFSDLPEVVLALLGRR